MFKKASKRFLIIAICMLVWFGFGMFGAYKEVEFKELSIYYLSLVIFVSTYLFGESVRKSEKTTMFAKGKSSKREIVAYGSIGLWLAAGIVSLQFKYDIVGLAGYFETLAPFVGAYIIGETYKPSNPLGIIDKNKKEPPVEQLNS